MNNKKILGWMPVVVGDLIGYLSANRDVAIINSITAWAIKHDKKPFSVRNYFYKLLKCYQNDESFRQTVDSVGIDMSAFDENIEEAHTKQILAKILDYSVKKPVFDVCMQISNQNLEKAKRIQNKYRNTLSNHPQIVEEVIKDLRAQGIPTRITFAPKSQILSMPPTNTRVISDQDIQSLIMGVVKLVKNNSQALAREQYKGQMQVVSNNLQKALIDNRRKDIILQELRTENEKIKNSLFAIKNAEKKLKQERDTSYIMIKQLVDSKKQKDLKAFISSLISSTAENTRV